MPNLTEKLRKRIHREGPIPFASFMEAALYDPEFGYYGAGRARLGREGDFFTSVSVGPLFGRLLARQFAEMWERLDRPARFILAEQGGHDGTLAADVLAALRRDAPHFADAVQYRFIEPSSFWRERQRESLERVASAAAWVETPGDLAGSEGVFFSNELLDAFPVHRVKWTGESWREVYVSWLGDRFEWVEGELSDPRLGELPRHLPAGYTTEVNLRAADWLRETAGALCRGWILAIDYGYEREDYYRPERMDGTLSAYLHHQRVVDPLQTPGEIDLTAHVEFSSLLEAAPALGCRVAGFTDQQRFTAGLGRLHFQDTDVVTPERAKEQRAFMTLLHPGLLGASFRVLALARDAPGPLAGFSFSPTT